MEPEIIRWMQQLSPRIEGALEADLPLAGNAAGDLDAAVRHAVFSGGKRMRPVLALAAARLAGCPDSVSLRIGSAVEYLHTASLILDDLPCMDDAAQRRGRETTHKRFGQGVAVLAALALMNQTYHILAQLPNGAALVRLAGECIGHAGMVAGQAIDLQAGRDIRDASHYRKTTALLRLSMEAPALACGADVAARRALAEYARCAGTAYQLVDDANDLAEDGAIDGAAQLCDRAAAWVARAKLALSRRFGLHDETAHLCGFADWLLAGAQRHAAARAQ